jgi:hypothetical protein
MIWRGPRKGTSLLVSEVSPRRKGMKTKKTVDDAPINIPGSALPFTDAAGYRQYMLEGLAKEGLTFSDCVHFFSKQQTIEELEYAEIAKNDREEEGELEFDDVPIVSEADTEHGAYVMAWVWIPGPDEEEDE